DCPASGPDHQGMAGRDQHLHFRELHGASDDDAGGSRRLHRAARGRSWAISWTVRRGSGWAGLPAGELRHQLHEQRHPTRSAATGSSWVCWRC
ncbi:hypothetical protein ABTK98_19280, partial [Acinetobacter baumannii]